MTTNTTVQAANHSAAAVDTAGEVLALAISNMIQATTGAKPSALTMTSEIAFGGVTHAMLDTAIASLFITNAPAGEFAQQIIHLTETSSGSAYGDSIYNGLGISPADIAAVVSGQFTTANAQALVPEAVGQGVEQVYSAFSGKVATVSQLYHEGQGVSNLMVDQGIASLFDQGLTAGQLSHEVVLDTINGGNTAWSDSAMNIMLIGQNPADYTAFHHIG